MSDLELPFSGEGGTNDEVKDEVKDETEVETEVEAKDEVADDATADDAEVEAAEMTPTEGGDGDVATPHAESDADVGLASEDAVDEASVAVEGADDREAEDGRLPGEGGDVAEENAGEEGERESVEKAGDEKEEEEAVASERVEEGEGEHEPEGEKARQEEGESAVAEDVGAEGDKGDTETKEAVEEEATQDAGQASEETEEAKEAKEAEEAKEASGALAAFAEEDELEAELEDELAVTPVLPVQLRVRMRLDEDAFTLDPALDENELPFELEEASVSSLSVIKPPPVSFELDRWEACAPSSETIQTMAAERERNYERHQALTAERATLARRNAVLQRKLLDHFKKRKMHDACKHGADEVSPELDAKYTKRLALFGELQASFEASRRAAADDVASLAAEEGRLADLLQDAVDALVAAEREITVGLVDSKSGKVISEKMVERLLTRQRATIKEVGDTRLVYIRLKEKVNAKEEAIKELEDLGQNLNMMDYEQLRMENQNLTDKLEERDDELARLRARAVHSSQALTHYKEKMCTVIVNLDRQLALLKQKERELEFARTELNGLKATRDRLRADLARESAQCGLLTKPQLLRDFERTLDECAALRAQLGRMQSECAVEKAQLTAVRQAVSRNAAVEVEIKPKRMTYMERVNQRIGEKKKRRAKAAKAAHALAAAVADEALFQM